MIRSLAGSGAIQLAGMLVTFVVGVLLARGLGVMGYGQYGVAMAVITLASVPGELGLPKLVTREVASERARNDLSRLYGIVSWSNRISVLIGLPVAGAVAITAFLIAGQEWSPVTATIAVGAPIIPLVALAKLRGAALQGLHFVILGQMPFVLLRPLLFSFLLLGLFTFKPDARAPEAMAMNVITAAAALVLAHMWLIARLPHRPARLVETGRRWLASSVPMALTEGLRMLYVQLGVLVLGIISTSVDVGLFRIATSSAVLVAVPLAIIAGVIQPVVARLHAEANLLHLQKLAAHCARAQFAGVLLLALPFFVAGGPLLSFIFGQDYGAAATSLAILAGGQIISAALGPASILLNMGGFETRVTRSMAIALSINAIAILALGPLFGHLGAACATALSVIVGSGLNWLDARRLLELDASVFGRHRGARA